MILNRLRWDLFALGRGQEQCLNHALQKVKSQYQGNFEKSNLQQQRVVEIFCWRESNNFPPDLDPTLVEGLAWIRTVGRGSPGTWQVVDP